MRKRYLATGAEWTIPFIDKSWKVISKLASKYGWKGYTPQFEIISSELMIDNSVFVGMPLMYSHWSFGKQKVQMYDQYIKGKMGIALEMIINSNPAVCYLSEDNSACEQLLVIAHAAVGHSHFFKNNHLFREWTDPESIIDYLVYARDYIRNCERKYGDELVEFILNAAHSLRHHGIDKNKRPPKLNAEARAKRRKWRLDVEQENKSELHDDAKSKQKDEIADFIKGSILANPQLYDKNPDLPESNLLYYIEKNSPILTTWQREILRIVRTISQYFYPQMQTKVMNEGFASFVHHTLMNDLYDAGYISEGYMLEFCHSHSDVLNMPDWDNKYARGLNPYKLGFEIFKDIQRMCTNPTEEDKEYFPELIGKNWVDIINDAVVNYRDESFIKQFLSPHLVRKLRLFVLSNFKDDDEHWLISAIQSTEDFETIRTILSNMNNTMLGIPNIEIWYHEQLRTDESLVLVHLSNDEDKLEHDKAEDTVTHIAQLWGRSVYLYNVKHNGAKYSVYNGYFKKTIPDELVLAIRGG